MVIHGQHCHDIDRVALAFIKRGLHSASTAEIGRAFRATTAPLAWLGTFRHCYFSSILLTPKAYHASAQVEQSEEVLDDHQPQKHQAGYRDDPCADLRESHGRASLMLVSKHVFSTINPAKNNAMKITTKMACFRTMRIYRLIESETLR